MNSSIESNTDNFFSLQKWQDYYQMCKPKVVALMLLTVLVGMHLATPGFVPLDILFFGTLGIALSAGSAAAINHLADHRIDTLMRRTEYRPIPQGRVGTKEALCFAISIGVIGLLMLSYFVNLLTAVLTAASLIGYALIYTCYLKRATPQNIVIGGLAGAAPPLLGWTAVTNQIEPNALLLVLIIFAWTPPHFWALALHRSAEYEKVNIPMLPITHGKDFTKLNILLYTILLCICSTLPYITQMSGMLYLVSVSVLNLVFLYYAISLKWGKNEKMAIKTFAYSIIYLMLLFIFILIDHYL